MGKSPNKTVREKTKSKNTIKFVLCSPSIAGHRTYPLLLSLVYVPHETPSEKTNFAFASSCQLEIASWLGMEAHVHLLSSPREALGPRLAWTWADTVHALASAPAWSLPVPYAKPSSDLSGKARIIYPSKTSKD